MGFQVGFKFRTAALCFALLAVAPLAAAQQEDIPARPRSEAIDPELTVRLAPTGTIIVRLGIMSGASIPFQAEVKLFSHMGFQQTSAPTRNDPQVTFRNVPVGEYSVEVHAPGFAVARDQAVLWKPETVAYVFVNLRPETATVVSGPSGYPVLAPKARKATEKGLQALRADRLDEARKQFERALKLAPGHPYVNFLVGILYLRTNEFKRAQTFLEKATKLGPDFPAGHEALGTALSGQGDFAAAIPPLERALALNPDRWELHWRIGMAFFQTGQFESARAHAERARDLSKGEYPEPLVLLGFSLARLGQQERALEALESFLAQHSDRPEAPRVRQAVEKLRQETADASVRESLTNIVAVPRKGGRLLLEVEDPDRPWAPPEVDAIRPPVREGVSCPLPEVLKSASQQVLTLSENLESIGATERIDHAELDPSGYERSSGTATFQYVVNIRQTRPGNLSVEDHREGGTGDSPERMYTRGLAAMAMIFHPFYVADFSMTCEGLGQWRGEPAWLVRFEQRNELPSRILLYRGERGVFAVPLKGRAWIGANSSQILRLETDLVRPMPEVNLQRQHLAIEYAEVKFKNSPVPLWLPSTVVMHAQTKGRRIRHQHVLSDFVLFSVATRQKIQNPDADPPPH